MYWRQSPISRNHTFTHTSPYDSYNPKKYPEDIECVYPSADPKKGAIYVSNVEAAENPATLKKYGIESVMTCAKGYHHNIPQSQLKMFKYFPCEDRQSCQISIYFDEAVQFIKQSLAQTNILVHCIAGVSRSVSMVIAYLMKEQAYTYDRAYQFVKSHRRIISPNSGFISQLKLYEQKLKRSSQSDKKYEHPTSAKPLRKTHDRLNDEDHRTYTSHQLTQKTYQTPKRNSYREEYLKNMPTTDIKFESSQRRQKFKQLDYDLNSKIEAIHDKYEKARNKLLSTREKYNKVYSIEKQTPIPTRTEYSTHKYRGNYETNYDRFKYSNVYENKYDYGLTTSPSLSGYRKRYIY